MATGLSTRATDVPVNPVAGSTLMRTATDGQAAAVATSRAPNTDELISHEPIWVCPHHLCLAPDGGRQPGRQRRRDRPHPRPTAPIATSCSSRSCASRATPAPICSASRCSWKPGFGPSCGSPGRPRAARNWWSSGHPIPVGNSLFNCAVVISDGAIRGIVPKQYIPNYKEFYESRWFSPATGSEPAEIELGGRRVPFGIDLLFEAKARQAYRDTAAFVVGIEICEDLWVPVPPSSLSGDGRGDDLAQPFGQQRDDRQEPVSHRSRRGPIGPHDRRLCDGRQRAVRIDDRRRLRRPLPDRRERPSAGRVAPGRRRPADPPRLVHDHPGRRRRQAAHRSPRHDQLRRRLVAREAVPPGSVLAVGEPWTA